MIGAGLGTRVQKSRSILAHISSCAALAMRDVHCTCIRCRSDIRSLGDVTSHIHRPSSTECSLPLRRQDGLRGLCGAFMSYALSTAANAPSTASQTAQPAGDALRCILLTDALMTCASADVHLVVREQVAWQRLTARAVVQALVYVGIAVEAEQPPACHIPPNCPAENAGRQAQLSDGGIRAGGSPGTCTHDSKQGGRARLRVQTFQSSHGRSEPAPD